jgi:rubrerythrin
MHLPVLMDKLSEYLMVEQGGLQLYEVALARCTDPELKHRYQEFARQTAHHREVLARLVERLGGDPSYVSPTARLAQIKATKLLESSLMADGLDPQESEANDLENVLLAETKDHADWHVLSQLAQQVTEPVVRDALQEAVQEVEAEEDQHVEWARQKASELCLRMVQQGPAPAPERWQRVISGPVPPITAVHPAPVQTDQLLPPAQAVPWSPSPSAVALAAGK